MIDMKFSIRRRLEDLSPDEIDREIELEQARAKQLVNDLARTIERQAELWETSREERSDDDSDA